MVFDVTRDMLSSVDSMQKRGLLLLNEHALYTL